jgi:hypothetical protein
MPPPPTPLSFVSSSCHHEVLFFGSHGPHSGATYFFSLSRRNSDRWLAASQRKNSRADQAVRAA